MNKFGIFKWAAFVFGSTMGVLVHAAPPSRVFPNIPPFPDAKTYWIAEYIEQNTIPMQIKGFETPASLSETIKFYEKWFSDKKGFGSSALGTSKLLGAKLGEYQVTVQLTQSQSGTVGTLTAAAVYGNTGNLDEKLERIGKGFPKPAGSDVISDTLSYDPGTQNRTIVVKNRINVETNALYLREEMVKLGWALNQDQTIKGAVSSSLIFRKGSQEMVVTISQKGTETWVVSSHTAPD